MDITGLLGFAMASETLLEGFNDNWKEDILEKWQASKDFPRKKKKKIRKNLSIEWQAASFDIFNYL